MERCENCFWNYGREGIKPPGDEFAPRFPNAVDRKLKDLFEWYRGKKEGELPAMIGKLRKKGIKLYTGSKMKRWQNNYEGLRWTAEDGHQLFGAIDEMLEMNSLMIVMDHKTTGSEIRTDKAEQEKLEREKAELYRMQLSTYALLLEKEGFEHPGWAYLHFIHADDFSKIGRNDKEILFCKNRLVKVRVEPEKALERFRKGLEILALEEPPKPNPECFAHNWAESVGLVYPDSQAD